MESSLQRPVAAWTLGGLAILPFPVLALIYRYFAHGHEQGTILMLMSYSAVVLGFLGGSRWGREITSARPRWGVLIPSMAAMFIAWGLRVGDDYLPLTWQLGGFIAAYLAVWLWDAVSPDLPGWYPRLRTALTAGACVSLAFALGKAWRG
jgi:hypothetical protein